MLNIIGSFLHFTLRYHSNLFKTYFQETKKREKSVAGISKKIKKRSLHLCLQSQQSNPSKILGQIVNPITKRWFKLLNKYERT